MEERRPEPTRLPIEIPSEDPFFQWERFQFGLRQVLTIMFGFFVWYLVWKGVTGILPLSSLLAGILLSPIAIGGIVLALVQRDGVPLEEYLTRRLEFMVSNHHYILREDSGKTAEALEEWEDAKVIGIDDDDDDDLYELPHF